MLFDPALVDAVYADRDGALGEVDLTAPERAWLVAPDPRRWRADPLRRARGLQALLEEFPASGAIVARTGGLDALDAFFSSPAFHRCVQARQSTALTFGPWLGARGSAALAGVAGVETAVAAVRRSGSNSIVWGAAEEHALAPAVEVRLLPAGSLAAFEAIRGALATHVAGLLAAVVDVDHAIGIHQVDPETMEGVVVAGPGSVSIGGAPIHLVRVLDGARRPASVEVLTGLFTAEGADPHEVPLLVAHLVDDGLLVRNPNIA
jgi:hypothetical protein